MELIILNDGIYPSDTGDEKTPGGHSDNTRR